MYKKLFFLFLFFLVYGCTQFLEEETAGKNIYVGDDGCVYCHTNKERLKLLAPEEEDAGGGDDGG